MSANESNSLVSNSLVSKMSISTKIREIKATLPDTTQLLAVSKFQPVSAIMEAYHAGQRIFGENKVQELMEKQKHLPDDIEWHFIGHLQTNKVKFIVPFISLIHSVDSLKLLEEIDRQAGKENRIIRCLLEIHVAQEDTKYGFLFEEIRSLYEKNSFAELPNVQVVGLMGMASQTDDEEQIRQEFHSLFLFFNEIKKQYAPYFSVLSMGMTDDYRIAIREGSTIVRIGSDIFGERIIN